MPTRKARNRIHGWIVVDKTLGLPSTAVVGKVRWLLNAEKAGHGGTLDPLATGLLPVALGEATKTVSYVMDGQKTYRFAVRWGAETSTDDLEGKIVATSNKFDPSIASESLQRTLESVLPQFVGSIQQRPPAFSAIKVDGERAYDLARAGEAVALSERTVQIDDVKIIENGVQTVFEVTCGKGTYVRSLARDIGRATGWLAHVVELRRTAVGPFTEADAISLEKLEEIVHRPASENSLSGILRPIETVLDGIPALAVMDPEAARLRQGQSVLLRGAQAPIAAEAVLVSHRGAPLGICAIEQGALKPKRLFNL